MTSAAEILEAMQCGRPRCACHSAAKKGRGNTHCPAHRDETPSLSVVERDGRVLLKCFAECEQEAVLGALRARGLWPASDGRPAERRRAERRFEVRNVDGSLVAVHVRVDGHEGKRFRWRLPDGTPGLGGRAVADLPLYRSEQLGNTAHVLVTEGEKAADAIAPLARQLGVAVVGTVTGANAAPSPASLAPLLGRTVFLWPDADEPGRRHMQEIARRLRELGAEVRLVEWAEAPPHGDGADFVAAGGTAEQLARLLEEARPLPAEGRQPVLVRLAEVEPEPVEWLWEPYVPVGKLTLLEGDPGEGKTTLALAIAAAVSRGAGLPGVKPREPGNVVILSNEDGLADTIRPRLDALEADVSRVVALRDWEDAGARGGVTLADLDVLARALELVRPKLVIVDPLQGFLGASVDMHRANEVRPVLEGLALLAERHGCAVLVIRHLRKSPSGRAIHRGLGSIDIAAAARSVLLLARPPDEPTDSRRRVMAQVKNSLAPLGPSLDLELTGGGIAWRGEVQLSAEQLLAPATPGEAGALREAEDFLLEALAAGPRPAREVIREAEQLGIAERTLRRAKEALGVRAVRRGFGPEGEWYWALPERRPEDGDLEPVRALGFSKREEQVSSYVIDGQGPKDGQAQDLAIYEPFDASESRSVETVSLMAIDGQVGGVAIYGAGGHLWSRNPEPQDPAQPPAPSGRPPRAAQLDQLPACSEPGCSRPVSVAFGGDRCWEHAEPEPPPGPPASPRPRRTRTLAEFARDALGLKPVPAEQRIGHLLREEDAGGASEEVLL